MAALKKRTVKHPHHMLRQDFREKFIDVNHKNYNSLFLFPSDEFFD